jgi:hypothetical protein
MLGCKRLTTHQTLPFFLFILAVGLWLLIIITAANHEKTPEVNLLSKNIDLFKNQNLGVLSYFRQFKQYLCPKTNLVT